MIQQPGLISLLASQMRAIRQLEDDLGLDGRAAFLRKMAGAGERVPDQVAIAAKYLTQLQERSKNGKSKKRA